MRAVYALAATVQCHRIDAVHGANYTVGATLLPQPVAMAATWDPELVRRAGEITAYQVSGQDHTPAWT